MAQIITTDSAVLKQRLLEVSEHVHTFPEELDAMMQGNYLSCNPDDLTLMIEFPVLQWEANYQGILHGGIISTMLDHTAGVMVLCFLGMLGTDHRLKRSLYPLCESRSGLSQYCEDYSCRQADRPNASFLI